MRRFFNIIFILIISVSAVVILAKSVSSLKENRILTKAPDVTLKNLLDPTFYSKCERYFNDHFVVRALLIKMKSLVDYHIFNTSSVADVHLGKNGWLYYQLELVDYKKEGCKDKEKMLLLAQHLHDLERVLEESGKQFVFTVAPNKATIYPEFVGFEQANSKCKKSKYEFFLEALEDYPVKNIIRLDTLFAKEKEDQKLYLTTDSHWNIFGAALLSKSILRHLAPATWHDYYPDIKITTCLRNGDLADMMAINLSTEEYCEKIFYHSQVAVDNKRPLENGWPRFSIKANSPDGRLLPRAVFYRDSFMDLPIKILKGSFKEMDTYWTYDLLTPEAIIDLQSAEIVLLEVVERNLDTVDIDIHGVEVALKGSY